MSNTRITEESLVFVGVRLPESLAKEIEKLASKKMSNRSQVIREAIGKGIGQLV